MASQPTTPALRLRPVSIPVDLNASTVSQTPWWISRRVFKEMETQEGKPFKCVRVLPTDPEWGFVWRYFHHDKPHRYAISEIFCLHQSSQQKSFEANLHLIEREGAKFRSTWGQEGRARARAKVIERWRRAAGVFCPFDTSEGSKHSWEHTKVMPLWHASAKGEEVYKSIAESGFVYFGKHNIGKSCETDCTSTDVGFFGSGIYFTNSARYAADIYSSGEVLMAWVSMREPFPVVGDSSQSDMHRLQGRGAYQHYNAHYVPVAPISNHVYEPVYYPAENTHQAYCDEVVVFHKSQALPRFWIKLAVEAPYLMLPSNIPQYIGDFTTHIMKLLEYPAVRGDQQLWQYLCKTLVSLMQFPDTDQLSDHGGDIYERLFQLFTRLIKTSGKINRRISRQIIKLPLIKRSEATTADPSSAQSEVEHAQGGETKQVNRQITRQTSTKWSLKRLFKQVLGRHDELPVVKKYRRKLKELKTAKFYLPGAATYVQGLGELLDLYVASCRLQDHPKYDAFFSSLKKKVLHDIVGMKAQEYLARAILASPTDFDVAQQSLVEFFTKDIESITLDNGVTVRPSRLLQECCLPNATVKQRETVETLLPAYTTGHSKAICLLEEQFKKQLTETS